MPEFALMDAEDIKPLSFEKPKSKTYRKSKRVMDLDSKKRLMKGIVLSKTKPSYNFLRGKGSLNSDFHGLRWLTKKKLSRFLQKLIRKNNWDEASGVLSVLLNATCKDKSLFKNRTKYLAAMELLKHISCESVDQKKFQHVFETWMKKIGTTRGSQAKDFQCLPPTALKYLKLHWCWSPSVSRRDVILLPPHVISESQYKPPRPTPEREITQAIENYEFKQNLVTRE